MNSDILSRDINRQLTLQEEVERLTARTVPMHMPGHKRGLKPSDALPYDWDITEIEGADDLHDAHGILEEAMERASDLWGSRRTW
jgi:arginine/lysine/ornithine decarboxylase